MDIQITITEHEIQKIAKSIGKPVSMQEATKVLKWTAKTLEALRAAGRPRIFETVVLSILRGKLGIPAVDKHG